MVWYKESGGFFVFDRDDMVRDQLLRGTGFFMEEFWKYLDNETLLLCRRRP
jgi:hypothetical protein